MSVATLDPLPAPAAAAPAPKRSANKDWVRALELTGRLESQPERTLPVVIDELAERFGDKPALLSDREELSFVALAERSRRYARWALDLGLGKGDVVALMMPNRPEYMALWLGLARVGVTTALINTQQRGASLAHSLTVAGARHIVVDAALAEGVAEIAADLAGGPTIWSHGESAHWWPRIDLAIFVYGAGPLTKAEQPPVTLADRALLIYTSGTTGLPKAANVSHYRVMSWSHWFAGLMDIQPGDRLYNCLPMCHSAGGVAAIGAALAGGASVAIAEKFSARRFWGDVARWRCTLFQYIGELCRYLLAAPTDPLERAHTLRLACGNGLAGDVWEAFQARFAIPRILEFYAATEGNFSLYNVEGKPGAIGRTPPFLSHRFPAAIVKFDADAGGPMRGRDGFCVRCAAGEAGEAVGRVSSAGAARFEGYTDAAATEIKLLRDVFARGDAWVRTGDLMQTDEQGFYYFVDRIGDTFRWKGENVAAAEVAAALRAFPGVDDACVYGVAVPGASGRAGMATLVAADGVDLAALRAHLAARLPDYARPVFLRLAAGLEVTETFKLKKQTLAAEGWDLDLVSDPLFFDDRAAGAYVRLGETMAEQVRSGALRL
ncbi:MAG TPA: long-chain-acyl-CoA synthetase [Caulobacteraceae bacterium]|nr:long-chain-acyl-CoA synthetase [Caulobacteraceae bacterium]